MKILSNSTASESRFSLEPFDGILLSGAEDDGFGKGVLMGVGDVIFNGFFKDKLNLLLAYTSVRFSAIFSKFVGVQGEVFTTVASEKLFEFLVVSSTLSFCVHSAVSSANKEEGTKLLLALGIN